MMHFLQWTGWDSLRFAPLAMLALAVIVVVLGMALAWLVAQRPVVAVAEPSVRWFGGAAVPAPEIARTIWSYWHDDVVPPVVARCMVNWQRLNPGYTVHMVSGSTLGQHLPDVPAGLHRLAAPKQSDWIRLALLARHGGIWLDASIFLTRSLDLVQQVHHAHGGHFVGYHLDRYADGSPFPVVDSWFLAAAAGSPFIRDWLALFQGEIVEGDTDEYLQSLQRAGTHAAYAQRIGSPSYHTVHVCAQQLLQEHPERYSLVLLRAEDGPYALHVPSRWKRKRLYVRLLWHRAPSPAPALIKLRGGERRKLAPYLHWGLYRRHSLVGQHLMP